MEQATKAVYKGIEEHTFRSDHIQKQQKQELQVLQDIKANKGRENLQLLKGVKR